MVCGAVGEQLENNENGVFKAWMIIDDDEFKNLTFSTVKNIK